MYRLVLGALARSTTCGIVVRNAHGRIAFANQGASKLLRFPGPRLSGVGPLRKAGVRLLDSSGAETGWDDGPFQVASRSKQLLVDYRYGLRFPDNETRWHVGTYVPIPGDSGPTSRVIAIYVDATPHPDYDDVLTRLRQTTLQLSEHTTWLREDLLQTLLGLSLTLQHHLAAQAGVSRAREDIEYAVGTLHDLASKVRLRATGLLHTPERPGSQ